MKDNNNLRVKFVTFFLFLCCFLAKEIYIINIIDAQLFFMIYSPETSKVMNYNFFIVDYFPKEVYADEYYNVTITFKNLGIEYARELSLTSFSKYFVTWKNVFFISKKVEGAIASEQYFGAVIQYENVTITLPIKVLDLPKGIYPLFLNLTYKDPGGNIKVESFIIYFEVKPKRSLNILKVNIRPEKLYYGDDFFLELFLVNDGKEKVEDCNLYIESKLKGQNQYFIGTIYPRNMTRVVLPFKATIAGDSYLKINITCKDQNISRTLPLYVFEKKPPIIRISSLDVSPERIISGEIFTLTIVLENYGEMDAEATKVVIKAPEGFKLREQHFVGNIKPEDTFTLIVDIEPEISEGRYEIELLIEYYDENGKKYSSRESILINVFEKKKFNLNMTLMFVLFVVVLFILIKKFRRK